MRLSASRPTITPNYVRRKQRREPFQTPLQTQKAERQRRTRPRRRNIAGRSPPKMFEIYDQYNRVMDDNNKATSRDLRRIDTRIKNINEALQYSHDEYMEKLSDEAYKLNCFVKQKYEGN